MFRKSGNRFSDKNMRKTEKSALSLDKLAVRPNNDGEGFRPRSREETTP
jgi:hypothetical protein